VDIKGISTSQSQRALLVTGLNLLYRYRLPLSAFIRLANEYTMIILGLSPLDVNFHPTNPMPTYIQFSPYAILNYATLDIPEEAVVKEE